MAININHTNNTLSSNSGTFIFGAGIVPTIENAVYSPNFSGKYYGDGSSLTGLATGNFITTGQTGAFGGAGVDLSTYITTGQTGAYAAAAGTGSFVTTAQTGVFALSANTGSFVTTAQTGVFALSADTGSFVTTAQTGVFALAANTGNFVTTGQTGVFLATGQYGLANQNRNLIVGGGVYSGCCNIVLNNSAGSYTATELTCSNTIINSIDATIQNNAKSNFIVV